MAKKDKPVVRTAWPRPIGNVQSPCDSPDVGVVTESHFGMISSDVARVIANAKRVASNHPGGDAVCYDASILDTIALTIIDDHGVPALLRAIANYFIYRAKQMYAQGTRTGDEDADQMHKMEALGHHMCMIASELDAAE